MQIHSLRDEHYSFILDFKIRLKCKITRKGVRCIYNFNIYQYHIGETTN